MPSLKPIPTLFETCLKFYGRHCIATLIENSAIKFERNDEDQQVQFARRKDSLLKSAGKYVHECMIVPIRSELLKFVLDEILHLKVDGYEEMLDVSISCHKEKKEVLWKIIRDFLVIYGGEGIPVHELDFSYVMSNLIDHLDNYQPQVVLSQTLFQDVSWAKGLVTLKLPNLWNAEIIKAVGGCCTNLQHLDISSRYLDDLDQLRYDLLWSETANIAYLGCLYGQYSSNGVIERENSGCPNLRTIALPRWGGCFGAINHVVRMIQFMPHLHVVKNIDTRLVAIKYMSAIGQLCSMKLTEYEEWDKRSCREERHEAVNGSLCRLLPRVKRYASYCNDYSVSPMYSDRELLKTQKNNFPFLEVIEVNYNNLGLLKIINFVDPMPRVKIFKLYESVDDIGILDIQALSATFPNLEKLILNKGSNWFIGDWVHDSLLPVFFPRLDTLQLKGAGGLNVSFLKIVLEKCPALKTLELFFTLQVNSYGAVRVTDKFVQDLSSSMRNLEKVTFAREERCPLMPEIISLTKASVLTILSACPNLKCLGYLGQWSVTRTEVRAVIDNITKNNWDLDLVYSSPFCEV